MWSAFLAVCFLCGYMCRTVKMGMIGELPGLYLSFYASHLPVLRLCFLFRLWVEVNSYGGLSIISFWDREVQNLNQVKPSPQSEPYLKVLGPSCGDLDLG